MDLIVFLGIFVGVPIICLLLMLYWRLSSNHQPRLGTADRGLQYRDWHAGWFYGATPVLEATTAGPAELNGDVGVLPFRN
jgi:hypothetical protein